MARQPVKRFPFRTVSILPTTFVDSMSYMEMLAKTIAKLNELIEYINDFETTILEQAKAYTDEKVGEVFVQINELRDTVTNLRVEVYNVIEENREWTQAQINNLTNYVNEAVVNVNERIDEFSSLFAERLENQRQELIAYVDEKTGWKVHNFITGQWMTAQEMFDYLCMFHLENALVVGDIEDYNNTVDDMYDYMETVHNWLVNGKNIIETKP